MTLVVPNRFNIQIKMTSDWHVGSGAGRGEIDSAVQRDIDGLPYIPAKTLNGILRDGCEQIALTLDGENEQSLWHSWVDFLFGDQPALAQGAVEPEPRPAVVCIRSARLDETLRKALIAKPQLKDAIAFIKPGVAIDQNTGSAKPDCLRLEEIVRMGAILTAQSCTLNFSETPKITDDQKQVAYALLVAGAKMVERLGGKRRRGNGTCTITIDAPTNEWIQWLQKNHSKVENPPEWKRQDLTSKPDSNPAADTTWYTIPLTIKTQTPIVIPKRTVGNVVESLDYIPGRYFLSHLHQALGDYLNVSQAIASGDLVITNATIAINDVAGRPTPFCVFGTKLDGGLSKGKGVYNRFQEPEPKDEQGKEIQTKGERSGYVGKFDGSQLPAYKTVSLELFTHNTIKDDVQRPTTDVGGVYSYQAIPAGTTLIAELRLPQSLKAHLDQQSNNWWNALNGSLQIGQSKKDQYGSVKITAKQPKQFPAQQVDQDNLLYVWFLSDVLLRDERLNPTTDPDVFRNVLANELGVTLTDRSNDNLLSLMMRSRRTESWQVRWGLPRPSMLGWQAGSCVAYQVQGEIKPEKLAELEAKGIGDRRAEGYGQICFNDPLLTTPLKDKTKREDTPEQPDITFTPITPGDPSFEYARLIETAAWREAIANRAMAIAADAQEREEILGIKITQGNGDESDKQPKSQPPMSQLGGLRSVFLKLHSADDIETVTRWLDALEAVRNRKKKWDKTQDGLSKIRSLVTDQSLVWSHLNLELDQLVITNNGVISLKQKIWAEAVRTLVDAMIRGQKRALEDVEKQANQSTQSQEVA
jgi:CRISPR-associated protein Csx10